MAPPKKKFDFYKNLSWDDLKEWAGDKIVSRGKGYQKSGQVEKLAITPEGALVAWVRGTHRYATLVDVQEEELISFCNCPYDDTCKHAVAVVLEAIEYLKKKNEIPQCSDKDKRLEALDHLEQEEDWEDEEKALEEEWEGEEGKDNSYRRNVSLAAKPEPSGSLQAFLEDQTKPQLINMIQKLSKTIPELNQTLENRKALSEGKVNKMVQSIRNEIDRLSSKSGWRNYWKHEGYTPDYSRVRERLESLLAKGYPDDVVSLGKELLEAGTNQVGASDDEGETGMEISTCLEVVFRALPNSSLSPVQQMLWAVEAELKDEYRLCDGLEQFWKHKFNKETWSGLADIILNRLTEFSSFQKEDEYSKKFRRDRLGDWAVQALEKAGRQKEIIPLCEQEVKATENYSRLVKQLVKADRLNEAEQWIQKGFKATLKEWQGIAHDLRNILRDIRKKEGNQLQVISFWAEDFFYDPTLQTFHDLQKAAQKAKIWSEVKEAAMEYLETGKRPQNSPPWPLPICDIPLQTTRRRNEFPIIHTLIDIAIAEKDSMKVLQWYDRQEPNRFTWGWGSSQDARVAQAIANEYPDRAVAIWKKLAEKLIAQTNPKAYNEAASFLRKINQTLKKLNRAKDWQTYLAELRQKNIRKIRLIEILDSFDDRPIIERTNKVKK